MAGVALLACLVAGLLVSAVGMLALLQTLQIGPGVGEILVFGPYDQPVSGWKVQALRVADRQRCVLNPTIMAQAPGSMVVEQRQGNASSFLVHWTGGGTSGPGQDCGHSADLRLGLQQMQAMANAAQAAHWQVFGW